MYYALYKDKSHLFNNATARWTKGDYSHTELVLSDLRSASSSFRDDGVRYKNIIYKPENWDFIDLSSLREFFKEEDVIAYYDARVGTPEKQFKDRVKYDVKGLYGFVNGFSKDNKNKLFCTESNQESLGFTEAWRYHPNMIPSVFRKYGVEIQKGSDFLAKHPELTKIVS